MTKSHILLKHLLSLKSLTGNHSFIQSLSRLISSSLFIVQLISRSTFDNSLKIAGDWRTFSELLSILHPLSNNLTIYHPLQPCSTPHPSFLTSPAFTPHAISRLTPTFSPLTTGNPRPPPNQPSLSLFPTCDWITASYNSRLQRLPCWVSFW